MEILDLGAKGEDIYHHILALENVSRRCWEKVQAYEVVSMDGIASNFEEIEGLIDIVKDDFIKEFYPNYYK